MDPLVLKSIGDDRDFWYGSESLVEGDLSLKVKCVYTNTTFCDPAAGDSFSVSKLFDLPVKMRKSSSAQYLSNSVLDEADSIEPHNFTSISGNLFLSLLFAWVVVFLCCLKVRTRIYVVTY